MEFFVRFKNALFLIAVLLVQTIALGVQVPKAGASGGPDGRNVRLLRLWATAMVTPFELAAHAVGSGVRNGWSNYVDLRHVRQQNESLQGQLQRMRIEQAAIAEDALAGRRLQALLKFREQYVASTVAAQVIGASGSEQAHVLTIDKGWRDGLRPDMPVITQDGIVGKLHNVFPDTSEVLEINDQTSGAGVIFASTRIHAILRGTVTGKVQIGNLTADSRIQPGEVVLTSGGDQVYPRGLPVGTVESIAPDPEHQPYTAIAVRPAVNLERVEEVLVITGTQPDVPAQDEQDLQTAEAQHASDGNASPAKDAAGTEPDATVTPPAVPKPLPAAHPDRFTSGATPPAAEMTPGAPQSPITPAPEKQP